MPVKVRPRPLACQTCGKPAVPGHAFCVEHVANLARIREIVAAETVVLRRGRRRKNAHDHDPADIGDE